MSAACLTCWFWGVVGLVVAYRALVWLNTYVFMIGYRINPKSFTKKESPVWVIVTGCTSGIGEGFVSELVARGFAVLMVSRSAEKLSATVAATRVAYPSAVLESVAVDFGSKDFLSVIDKAAKNKDIVMVVNNVGANLAYPKLFAENSYDEIEEIIAVNVRTTTLLSRWAVERFHGRSEEISRSNGLLVNVSSLFGSMGSPMLAVYAGTKAFVEAFSSSVAAEENSRSVQVFCSTPGYVVSNMSKLRKESLSVLSGRTCARNILAQAGLGGTGAAPHWSHAIIYGFLISLPENFRLSRILNFHKIINAKAIRKDKMKSKD